MINWLSVSTTLAALRPWRISGSCTDNIRSLLTPIPDAHPVILTQHVLEQQLSRQLRRRHYPLSFGPILGLRIASNQMLLNFGRTRPPGGSSHEIREAVQPRRQDPPQRIGGSDLRVTHAGHPCY